MTIDHGDMPVSDYSDSFKMWILSVRFHIKKEFSIQIPDRMTCDILEWYDSHVASGRCTDDAGITAFAGSIAAHYWHDLPESKENRAKIPGIIERVVKLHNGYVEARNADMDRLINKLSIHTQNYVRAQG